MYSEQYGFAATPDLVATTAGTSQYVVIDWKTSTAWQHHWFWQVAAYCMVVKEVMGLKPVPTAVVVRFHEDGYEMKTRTPTQVKSDFNAFLSILNTYKLGVKHA